MAPSINVNMCLIMTIPDPKKLWSHHATFVLGCWSVCTELGCSVRGLSWRWWSMRRHVMENLGMQHRIQQLQMKFFCMVWVEFLIFFWVDALQLFSSYCWYPWTSALDWRCFWWASSTCVKPIRKQSHHFRLGLSVSSCCRNESELLFRPHSPNWMKENRQKTKVRIYFEGDNWDNSRKQEPWFPVDFSLIPWITPLKQTSLGPFTTPHLRSGAQVESDRWDGRYAIAIAGWTRRDFTHPKGPKKMQRMGIYPPVKITMENHHL